MHEKCIGLTEYVGVSYGDTMGLVIPNIDNQLASDLKIEGYRSIGVLGARSGAGPQIFAMDNALKATNAEIISIELPRDTKGGAGHGCLLYIGSDNVSDVRNAIELALPEIDERFKTMYVNSSGHFDVQYTARAGSCVKKIFNAIEGEAFAFICAAPASLATLVADQALKEAPVTMRYCGRPYEGTSLSNEIIITISGEASSVRTATERAKEIALELLQAWGEEAKPVVE